ncbi:MAG: sugar-binding domain-containing protein [Bacteroidota bacterium]
MKKIPLVTLIFVFCIINSSYSQSRQLFNLGWKFALHEQEGAQATDYDDNNWKSVILPHDASISGKFDRRKSTSANGWLPHQQGWYRKTFTLPENEQGKKVFIEFEGVYRNSKVWINGQLLGRNLNGYLGFEYDLTPYIKFGHKNIITVHFDNRVKYTSRWYTGAGIYRNVWLKVVNPVYVAYDGTYITTPFVSEDLAKVTVETDVVNEKGKEGEITVETKLIDPKGVVVATKTDVVYLQFLKDHTFHQEFTVIKPELWDTKSPNLYYAKTKISFNGEYQGDYQTRFGIRDIELTPEHGLLLNGSKVFAQGGNIHHDLGCLGAVALKEGYRYRLEKLKKMGCNSLRLSHNPHAPVLLDLCDEMGILVISEAYDKWTSQFYGREVAFRDIWKKDMERFIKRDRNHPSVYIWSVGNETNKQLGRFERKFETKEDAAMQGADVLKELVAFVHKLDPSRKVTAALYPARKDVLYEWDYWDKREEFMKNLPPAMAFHMDVVSWNYKGDFFGIDYKNYPQMMFIASEAGTNLDFGYRKISWVEFDKKNIIGHYFWTVASYLGESFWPNKSWERAFYGMDEQISPIGHIYQSLYNEEPKLKIMVKEPDTIKYNKWDKHFKIKRWHWYPMLDHWNFENGVKLEIQAFTNCDEVELSLNNTSLGNQKLEKGEEPILYWDVNYTEGELIAIGKRNNKVVAKDTLVTSGKSTHIVLSPNKKTLKANGSDLVYVRVSLQDDKGYIVPEDKRISFEVKGPATIAGVANADIFSDELWQGNERSAINGICLVVLRTTNHNGMIELIAKAEGLKSGKLVLNATKDN